MLNFLNLSVNKYSKQKMNQIYYETSKKPLIESARLGDTAQR